MMKKQKAATPYMIPTRLWSTVVTQLHQPVFALGRANKPPEAATEAIRLLPCSSSVETLQVGDEGGDLILRQLKIGHLGPLLHARGVAQPSRQIALIVLEDRTGKG